ncbi:MAG: GAF domain-containing protein [Ignavibacteriae bacterium]|nr:GAF domain-containing protein [Ignavibacteriota bacterium]
MSAELKIAEDKDLNEIYNLLFQQIDGLLNKNEPKITNLSNITAALKQTFSKISWVGFYLLKDNLLYLGPFQGKVACTRIEVGKGVCGTAAYKNETQVVTNVHEFPGHIACDVESNSEIVVPIMTKNNLVCGVLDLDSTEFSAFCEIDKIWLEKICKLISEKLELNKNLII